MTTVDSLTVVSVDELLTLKDLFLVEWPKYMTAWNTIDSQYRNLHQNKDFPVKVCLPFGSKDNGVVVIWQLIPDAYEVGLYCLNGNFTKMKEAILTTNKIDWSLRMLFSCIREELVEGASDILKIKNMKVIVDGTYVTHINRDVAKSFEVDIPADVKIEKAKIEHAVDIDAVWPHRYPGSEDYFRNMINWGLVTVLLGSEKDELRGWVLTSVRGDEHALQVKDEFKRRGYGQILVKWLGKKLANSEREVFGCVVTNNTASQAMFKKMNFNQLYTTYWVVGMHK